MYITEFVQCQLFHLLNADRELEKGLGANTWVLFNAH